MPGYNVIGAVRKQFYDLKKTNEKLDKYYDALIRTQADVIGLRKDIEELSELVHTMRGEELDKKRKNKDTG